SITYTYVVTNTGDLFSVSGTITDDKNGSVGSFRPEARRAGQTLTKAGTVTGTLTNTGTATGTFTDASSTSATATDTATVTGHLCTISLDKTAGTGNVCTGSSTSVTYTYIVTNNSDFFTVSGSITDDKNGSVGSF